MQPHRLRLLFSKDQIEAAVGMLADQLNQRFAEKDPLFLVVMNGAYMFATDLLKQFIHPCTLAFIDVKSYSGTTRFVLDADSSRIPDLTNRHVVILEDIVDSGTTMAWLKKETAGCGAASVTTAALLNKLVPHEADADLYGLDVEDLFVVGYGLDLDGRYRNLPQIFELLQD